MRQLGGSTRFGEGASRLLEVLLLHQSTRLEDPVIDRALCLAGLELISVGYDVLDSYRRRPFAPLGYLLVNLTSLRKHL